MTLVVLLVLNAASVPLLRGRLSALADLRFRRTWLLAAAAGTQVLFLGLLPGRLPGFEALLGAGHLLSYVLAGAFVVANLRIPGLWLIALGGALNAAAIAANGGVMPAAAGALSAAGMVAEPSAFTNSALVAGARLSFLGDVFAIPAAWPLANVFSVGDVLLLAGGVVVTHRVSGSRLLPPSSGQFAAVAANRPFVRLWAAQGLSHVGDYAFALAVVTGVAEYGGARLLATLLILQVGPSAVAGLLAGAWIDRVRRTATMVSADVVRGAAVASLLLVDTPSLAHLYGVAVVLGLGGALFGPSLQASVPNVVRREHIVPANALLSATFHFAIAAGPVLGGLLVSASGIETAYAFNAATFAASALLVATVRLPDAARDVEALPPIRALVEGMRYARVTPLVRGVLLVTGVLMFAAAMKSPLEPLFVLDVLDQPASSLGLLLGMWGLGMLLGSLATPLAVRLLPRERLLALSIATVGVSVLVVALSSRLALVLPLWLLAGIGNALGTVSYETLLQERVPDRLRGRVIAASEAVLDGAYLAGAFAAGWLGGRVSIRAAFVAAALTFLTAALLSRRLLPTQPRVSGPRWHHDGPTRRGLSAEMELRLLLSARIASR